MNEKEIIKKIKWWLLNNIEKKQGKNLIQESKNLLKFIKMWENMDY